MSGTQKVLLSQGDSRGPEQKLARQENEPLLVEGCSMSPEAVFLSLFGWLTINYLAFKKMLLKFIHTSSIELHISKNTITPRIYCVILHLKMNLKSQWRKKTLSCTMGEIGEMSREESKRSS